MVVALATQMVNSGLGMGFAPLVMSFVIGMGLSPVIAAATINLANTGVSLVSGYAHHRYGNLHWPTVIQLALPGAIGAFIAAVGLGVLAFNSPSSPITNLVLIVIGLMILWRYGFHRCGPPKLSRPKSSRLTIPAGLAGGAMAASTGLGWGAVPMSVLTNSATLEPRKIVGSVAAAEAAVAASAVTGFLLAIPAAELLIPMALGIFIAGAITAPLGAWAAHKLPAAVLGTSIGALLLSFNGSQLSAALAFPAWLTVLVLTAIFGVWGWAVWRIYRAIAPRWVSIQNTPIPAPSNPTTTEPTPAGSDHPNPISDHKPATKRESTLKVGKERDSVNSD